MWLYSSWESGQTTQQASTHEFPKAQEVESRDKLPGGGHRRTVCFRDCHGNSPGRGAGKGCPLLAGPQCSSPHFHPGFPTSGRKKQGSCPALPIMEGKHLGVREHESAEQDCWFFKENGYDYEMWERRDLGWYRLAFPRARALCEAEGQGTSPELPTDLRPRKLRRQSHCTQDPEKQALKNLSEFPTYKPSSCELSKKLTCVLISDHIS